MKVYCVALNESMEDWDSLEEKWPTFPVTSNLAFVTLKDSESAGEICDLLGMNDKNENLGIVSRVFPGQYAGYNKKRLWEWLKKELKEATE